MSQRIERSITIEAPARAVWDLVQNASRRPEWDARVVACEVVTDSPFGKGSRARNHYRLSGLAVPVVMETVTWAPPHRSTARALPNPIAALACSWRFDQRPDGTTVFTTTIDLRCETGILRAVRERVLRRTLDRLTLVSHFRLKRLAEFEHPDRIATSPAARAAAAA